MSPLASEAYRIGWVCALREEMVAARAMLDDDHGRIKARGPDQNTYYAGCVHDHKVVIAGLPAGIDGQVSAASVVKDMMRTFTALKFVLLVGIGGGIPCVEEGIDVRLGDVVVSMPSNGFPGVVQYDRGKKLNGHDLKLKGSLSPPPIALLTALTALQTEHDLNGSQKISEYLSEMIKCRPKMHDAKYVHQGVEHDRLFKATYQHPPDKATCAECLSTEEVRRPPRKVDDPVLHYGVIASGEAVLKDPIFREHLRKVYGARCVEMEAAGVMHNFPCLVIRGICDYADSHKNDAWHNYAAAVAAAFAKELLTYIDSGEVESARPMQEVLGK